MGSSSAIDLMVMTALVLVVAGLTSLAGAWEEPSATEMFHVGGKVLCQDCTQGWNEWVQGANPIQGCKVAVTCMDERRRIVFYGSDETDEKGQYEVSMAKYMNNKELKPKSCTVRLVSSPDPTCNIATDFAGGLSGVKLARPTSVYREVTKFMLKPFYYTTPMCDQPDTNDSDEEEEEGPKY